MIKKVLKKILDFIVGEIGILILSIFLSICIVFVMWIVICENEMITLEYVEIYDEISNVNITCRDVNSPLEGFIIDITNGSEEEWYFYNYPGYYVITFFSIILFTLFTAWNIISGIVSGIFKLLYGNKLNNQIYTEFSTPEYDVILRTGMLYECVSIKEIQKKLLKVKEEKEKNKDNLNQVEENLIFSNIDEEDELYKLVMNYKWSMNETKENKQFNDIHILINQRMREHGLLKRFTVNDFIMMFSNNVKIDKNELFNWCRRIVIEIIAILFTLKLSQLINETLWNVVSIIVIFYVFGRMMYIPYTKKYREDRRKINIYNKMYSEKWSK